ELAGDLRDVDVLPAGVDAAQGAERGGVLAHEGDLHPQALAGALWAVTSRKASFQSRANRAMPKRSSARRRAPSPSRRASAGSRSRRRVWATSARGSVSTQPETPFSIAVAISVVASPTTGMPSIIASQTASPRLV